MLWKWWCGGPTGSRYRPPAQPTDVSGTLPAQDGDNYGGGTTPTRAESIAAPRRRRSFFPFSLRRAYGNALYRLSLPSRPMRSPPLTLPLLYITAAAFPRGQSSQQRARQSVATLCAAKQPRVSIIRDEQLWGT